MERFTGDPAWAHSPPATHTGGQCTTCGAPVDPGIALCAICKGIPRRRGKRRVVLVTSGVLGAAVAITAVLFFTRDYDSTLWNFLTQKKTCMVKDDCPGMQACYCAFDAVDGKCVDEDDMPNGICLSRNDYYERLKEGWLGVHSALLTSMKEVTRAMCACKTDACKREVVGKRKSLGENFLKRIRSMAMSDSYGVKTSLARIKVEHKDFFVKFEDEALAIKERWESCNCAPLEYDSVRETCVGLGTR